MHVNANNILAEQQKGGRKGTMGCKEQLTIDAVTMTQAVKHNRNLAAVFIDYKKAYDMVPHSWLVYVLETYKIHPYIIEFLKTVMNKWNTKLIVSSGNTTIETGTIKINRGIFQGDSLSTLWFCLSINPLSTLLQHSTKGVNIKTQNHENYSLTHLLYIDDLKLYANSESNLKQSLRITESFSRDVKLEFGVDKCRTQNIKKGKLKEMTPYGPYTDENIKCMEENETYKYLGIEQSRNLQHTKIKAQLRKAFNERLKQICKKSLNSRNLVKAINTYAISILTYSFGIVKWTKTDLDQLEVDIRNTLRRHNYRHPQSAVERVSLPRSKGGRGIISITRLHSKQITKTRQYFYEKSIDSNLHSATVHNDDKYTPLDLKNQELQADITPIQQKITEWKSKARHGQYLAEMSTQHVDKEASLKWLTNGILFPETEGFLIAIQDNVIPTKNYRKYILKEQLQDDMCRKCKTNKETIEHILAGCTTLTQTEYKNRHDNMGKIVHKEIAIRHKLTSISDTDWQYRPDAVLENNTHKILWDRTVLTEASVDHNRPDTILIDKASKKTYLIDYAVVNTSNLVNTYNTKIAKYTNLAEQIKTQWSMSTVHIIPIIISTNAIVPKTTLKSLEQLGLDSRLISRLQFSMALSSCSIVRRFMNKDVDL